MKRWRTKWGDANIQTECQDTGYLYRLSILIYKLNGNRRLKTKEGMDIRTGLVGRDSAPFPRPGKMSWQSCLNEKRLQSEQNRRSLSQIFLWFRKHLCRPTANFCAAYFCTNITPYYHIFREWHHPTDITCNYVNCNTEYAFWTIYIFVDNGYALRINNTVDLYMNGV